MLVHGDLNGLSRRNVCTLACIDVVECIDAKGRTARSSGLP
jgi:hypothetical protein